MRKVSFIHFIYARESGFRPYSFLHTHTQWNVWVRWSGVVKSSHFWCLLLFFFFNTMGFLFLATTNKSLNTKNPFYKKDLLWNTKKSFFFENIFIILILRQCNIVSRIYETNVFRFYFFFFEKSIKFPGSKKKRWWEF